MTALTRLLQLASPALPVGAYTYSQGLEWAVEEGTVRDEATTLAWIGGLMELSVGRFEVPLLARLMAAWQDGDGAALERLDGEFVASRETAELRAETLQMGYSLVRLLNDLGSFPAERLARLAGLAAPSYPLVWSCAATAYAIPVDDALAAWLWSWCENQVMAALKAVPLGQSAGQRILLDLGGRIPAVVVAACEIGNDALSNFAPAFAIACCRHETQYSRLFRS
jgi:urease accessory protein